MNDEGLSCDNGGSMPMVEELSSNQQKIREIRISQLDNGYVVHVGCKTFAIEKKDDLISKLMLYINSPNSIEKAYFAGDLFL